MTGVALFVLPVASPHTALEPMHAHGVLKTSGRVHTLKMRGEKEADAGPAQSKPDANAFGTIRSGLGCRAECEQGETPVDCCAVSVCV